MHRFRHLFIPQVDSGFSKMVTEQKRPLELSEGDNENNRNAIFSCPEIRTRVIILITFHFVFQVPKRILNLTFRLGAYMNVRTGHLVLAVSLGAIFHYWGKQSGLFRYFENQCKAMQKKRQDIMRLNVAFAKLKAGDRVLSLVGESPCRVSVRQIKEVIHNGSKKKCCLSFVTTNSELHEYSNYEVYMFPTTFWPRSERILWIPIVDDVRNSVEMLKSILPDRFISFDLKQMSEMSSETLPLGPESGTTISLPLPDQKEFEGEINNQDDLLGLLKLSLKQLKTGDIVLWRSPIEPCLLYRKQIDKIAYSKNKDRFMVSFTHKIDTFTNYKTRWESPPWTLECIPILQNNVEKTLQTLRTLNPDIPLLLVDSVESL